MHDLSCLDHLKLKNINYEEVILDTKNCNYPAVKIKEVRVILPGVGLTVGYDLTNIPKTCMFYNVLIFTRAAKFNSNFRSDNIQALYISLLHHDPCRSPPECKGLFNP